MTKRKKVMTKRKRRTMVHEMGEPSPPGTPPRTLEEVFKGILDVEEVVIKGMSVPPVPGVPRPFPKTYLQDSVL
jgi:hypothetical protein